MTNRQNDQSQKPISFPIIVRATKGDVVAICHILRHYDAYILKLSTRSYRDPFGNVYSLVDEALRRRLETKLITKILTFEIVP